MSKKDYQAIAGALWAARVEYRTNVGGTSALDSIQVQLADIMAADSPRFDRGRFIEACETGKCKSMRSVA